MRTSGIPIETAATSSSRSAIQARPRRESRSRTLTNRTSIRITKITQYQGLRCSSSNVPSPGRWIGSSALMPMLPAVSVVPPPRWMLWPLIATRSMISPKASVTIAM